MRLSGVTVYVRDWPAAVKWYSEVLGLTIGPYEAGDQFWDPEGNRINLFAS